MQVPAGGSMKKRMQSRPSVLPDRPMRRTRSSIEIQKFAEDDDEDFSDIFGPESSIAEKEESERGSEDNNGLMLMSKVSSNSWLGDDEDEDDPFASMDPGWDEMDLEANIARDRHARLAQKVEELIGALKSSEGEDLLADLSEDLVSLHTLIGTELILTFVARSALGEQRSEEPHHQRTWLIANIGDSRALHSKEQAVHDLAALEGSQRSKCLQSCHARVMY